MKRKALVFVAAVLVVAVAAYLLTRNPSRIVLTGVVTTDEVIVSSQIQGRIGRLVANQGDAVKQGALLAEIQPEEWKDDMAFFEHGVSQAEADLHFQEVETVTLIRQAEANLAAAKAQAAQGEADRENADLAFQRETELHRTGADSQGAFDQARTADDSAKARAESLHKQALAAEAAVAAAKAQKEQVAARRAALAAAEAQKDKAATQLGYTELRAPTDGIVNVRAALPGEVVAPGQPVVTLVNPDDLWVRADVEEGSIDRIRLGQKLTVRLPSGAEREGTVFFRGVDADYATQRDVSRTKRDIKTFEVRLRCDNSDRALALGMSAYVILPL